MFRGTHVSPAQALSDNGNNSKCNKSKSITSSYVILLIYWYVCMRSYMSVHVKLFSYVPHKQKWKREITPKVLIQELYNLNMMSPLIILCPWMKFHYNTISRTGVIFRTKKSDKGK